MFSACFTYCTKKKEHQEEKVSHKDLRSIEIPSKCLRIWPGKKQQHFNIIMLISFGIAHPFAKDFWK